jgi:secretory phospholipase A2
LKAIRRSIIYAFILLSSNGCGSLDVIFDDSDSSLIYFDKAFTECCNTHDHCYDECNADKEECDYVFKRCLYAVCKREDKRNLFDEKKCKAKAKLSFVTVIGVGCDSFRSAQKQACICKKAKEEL